MALPLMMDEQNGFEQGDLFKPTATVHDVVEAKGAKGAVTAAQIVALEPKAPSLSRALAGRMGRQIADTAAATIVREFEGAAERGYSYSAWCLAGLPHRELAAGKNWLIETDFARLLVRPGVRLRDDNSEEALRVPMGSFARLLLVDWQTEALERGSREIIMGKSASALMTRLNINRGGPSNGKVVNQLERLATCAVDFSFGNDRRGVIVNQRLVEAFEYVANPDPRTRQSMRLIERVRLSQAFFDELRRHPVPVDRGAIRQLTKSPMAIDIYLWLAFRLHSLERETPVSWDKLWRQFGTRVGLLKNFRPQFEGPLHLALSTYKAARVRVVDRGLILVPSPAPVPR
ncbi:replication protein RepA [Roseomonas sp. F4]